MVNFNCNLKDKKGQTCGKQTVYGIFDILLVNTPEHMKSFLNCAMCEDHIVELFGFPKDWFQNKRDWRSSSFWRKYG